jgi:hypothetical protein
MFFRDAAAGSDTVDPTGQTRIFGMTGRPTPWTKTADETTHRETFCSAGLHLFQELSTLVH